MNEPINRIDIIQQINYCKLLNTQENYQQAFDKTTSLIPKIMNLNFHPILNSILSENLLAASKLSKYSSICRDLFMLLSPKLRAQNLDEIFQKLNDFINSQSNLLISFEGFYTYFFPIDIDVHYDLFNIVAGDQPTIKISFLSHLPQNIQISNFSFAFTHEGISNNKEEELMKIEESFELVPKLSKKMSIARHLPPSISKENLVAIIIQINEVFIRLSIRNTVINVIPDEKALKIDAKLPKISLINTDLPFFISLTADDQKIEKLDILLTTENPKIPLTITGTYNNTNIEIGKKISLQDINPHETMTLNLHIRTLAPIFNPVIFKYRFGTSLSGIGQFEKIFSFDFQSPFIANFQLYDENYMIIRPNEALTIEDGKTIIFEVSLKNNISIPIKILKIDPPSFFEQESEDGSFDILPYEQYTFMGEIKQSGQYDINVFYQTDQIEKSVFTLKLPSIAMAVKNYSFNIDCPLSAPVFKEFEMKLKFDRTHFGNDKNSPEVCQIRVDIDQTDNFFIQGSLEGHKLYLFKKQTKEISIKMIPLVTGSIPLPLISITDLSISQQKPKKILKSIVINYR